MKILSLISASTVLMVACSDLPTKDHKTSTGTADFTKYMAFGNSLTHGVQSNAVYDEAQKTAYPRLLAMQAGVSDFQYPSLTGDGTGGRITWWGNLSDGSPVLVPTPNASAAVIASRASNILLARPYNNMGISGAILVIPGTAALGNATDFFNVAMNNNVALGGTAVIGPGGIGGNRGGLFSLILRTNGASLWTSAKAYQPTFVSLWLGNNDVLGYATSGGTNPSSPTSAAVFTAKYDAVLDSLLSLNGGTTKVAIATIPDVTVIPFFTTVNVVLKGRGMQKIYFVTNYGTGIDSLILNGAGAPANVYSRGMVTLQGSGFLGNGIDNFTGLAKAAPLPNAAVLDTSEIRIAKTALTMFNLHIKSKAANAKVAVVDVNAEFNSIAAAGSKYYQGIKVTPAFITGGIFSYDGVHPTALGQGLIANYFIESINAKFGATISPVQLSTYSNAKFGKESVVEGKLDLSSISPDMFDNTLRWLGAKEDY